MADIPSTNSKIQIEETTYRAPVSETLTQRMGGSINYALDQIVTTSGALAAETAARIAADNTINGKLVARQVSSNAGTSNFDSSSTFNDLELMETQSFSVSYTGNNKYLLIMFNSEIYNTGGSRDPSYIDIDLIGHNSFGTQSLYQFSGINGTGGQCFGTVIALQSMTNPLQIRLRQFASSAGNPVGFKKQRWSWNIGFRYTVLDTAAVFGA
jgi:hypothetical protein